MDEALDYKSLGVQIPSPASMDFQMRLQKKVPSLYDLCVSGMLNLSSFILSVRVLPKIPSISMKAGK